MVVVAMVICVFNMRSLFILSVVVLSTTYAFPDLSAALDEKMKGVSADLDEIKKDLEQKTRRDVDIKPEPVESWTGKWFPEKPTEAPKTGGSGGGMDGNNMWKMINSTCDDGKSNLTVDWNNNDMDYICAEGDYLEPDTSLKATLEQEHIPPMYIARHVCMKSEIPYEHPLLTFGPHRPAWAKYGEYKYLPPQRYLHNMEHGGIIFLYHPCAAPSLVNKLKKVVKSCLYRHVISASRLVPKERPFVLLSWGWRMLMPTADTKLAVEFIREHALHGYEKTHRDGYYDQLLVDPAKVVSTPEDQELCPKYKDF
ncbi:uncharacterized protein LOC128992638 [Macrosteles quadrilineatus]|uniref:uncharacterized protein LOC128992638 n=1 Tax=Macrosteles quadrilineatus TaxID=74068 RepID=UPI0023E11D1B|nr:uncharacterized protein LOC128992638 [Macrosteles quadrilineatus]